MESPYVNAACSALLGRPGLGEGQAVSPVRRGLSRLPLLQRTLLLDFTADLLLKPAHLLLQLTDQVHHTLLRAGPGNSKK